MAKKQTIHIREIDGNESIHEVDVTGKPESFVDRVVRGMQINLDSERFWIDTTEAYPELPDAAI